MNQQQLADKFINIWIEVMGRKPTETEPISGMEQTLFKEFIAGRETEITVRETLQKVKTFNS